MRFALDTHIFVWMQDETERLGEHLGVLADRGNELLVSAVVGWELAIKTSLGKLELPKPVKTYVPETIAAVHAQTVPVELEHALAVADLPDIHRDPFDRLLVAQTRALGATLVTADAVVDRYPVDTLLVG